MKRILWILIAAIWFITVQSYWVDLYYPDYRKQRNEFIDEYLRASDEFHKDPKRVDLYKKQMQALKKADSCNTLYGEKINKKWVLHIGKAMGL